VAAALPSSDALIPPAAALALVPGYVPDDAQQRIGRLSGGSVNDLWRVDTARGSYALRLDGAAWRRPGVDRRRELRLHRAAAAAGIAPRIVACSPARDVLVLEYLPARSWRAADYAEPQQLRRLALLLRRLHTLPAPRGQLPVFDPLAIAHSYARSRGVAVARARPAIRQLLQDIVAAQAQLARSTRAPVIVHGDPLQGNVLDDGQRLWLIDFEYAQLADPIYDLAAVLACYPRAELWAAMLLTAAGLAGAGLHRQLTAAVRVHAALGQLWRYARGEPLDSGAPCRQTSAPLNPR
jgi:aminoglycoside phosphotransferase (APT) family kinase protein